MARDIFRKDVLDRMASPDRLDRSVQLVRSGQWVFLTCLVVLLIFGLIWSALADLPIRVATRGILVDPVGLREITVAHEGRVDAIAVAVGDLVAKGDMVAMLSQDVRRRDVEIAETALRNARDTERQAAQEFAEIDARRRSSEDRLLGSLEDRITDINAQLDSREVLAEELRHLVRDRIAVASDLLDAVDRVDNLRAELREVEQQKLEIELTANERTGDREREALASMQRIDILERELERITAQVTDETRIVAPRSGLIAELKVNPGDVVLDGRAIALIDPMGESDSLEAIIYMAPAEGKRIRPGMVAEIVPTTTERELFGHVQGKVISVTAVPATPAGMRRQLQNDALVAELSASGAPLEIRIELGKDESTPSGLAWSSSQGPDLPVSEGTMVEGSIIVERRRILHVLLPGLNRRLSAVLSTASAPIFTPTIKPTVTSDIHHEVTSGATPEVSS